MNSDSDLQIAGDILAVQHLLQPAPEHPSTVSDFVRLARTITADRARWAHLVQYDAGGRRVPPPAPAPPPARWGGGRGTAGGAVYSNPPPPTNASGGG
ncbi:cysteine dioxygenase, partial [Streptomyces sp. NPDC059131]